MSSEELIKRKNDIFSKINKTIYEIEKGKKEVIRVNKIVENTKKILDDLDNEFSKKTGLNKLDISCLFVAVGLQIARQYLLTKFPERLDDQVAGKKTKANIDKNYERCHKYYNPSLEEIIKRPVPFDANIGSNGGLCGGGRMGHRVTAIGHDPILGLIFGTANIATSTLTTSSFISYHITSNEMNRDSFSCKAQTDLVLKYTLDKLVNQGIEGKKIIATSLIKEIEHLQSDIYTKNSLPLPFISGIDSKLASKLADYGFDMANVITVGKQVTYASLINSIIAMIHRMFYNGSTEIDEKLYEVKTRKILSYSNLIASSSNSAVVAVTKKIKLLDLGGLGVTIYRLITDAKFIRSVKEEFIFGSYKDMIMSDV